MALMIDPGLSERLLEALERFRSPPGEGLRAESRWEVPKELADAFEALLQGDPQPAAGLVSPTNSVEVVPGQIDSVERLEPTEMKLGSPPPEAALPSPAELLGMQFELNMHLFEVRSMSSVRERGAQQLQDALRRSD